MFGSTILEIAIGLVFVYWLLSMICSALNEFVARIFALRANILEEGVRNLLQGNSTLGGPGAAKLAATAGDLTEKFYKHGLIRSISSVPKTSFLSLIPVVSNLVAPANPQTPASKPNYIPTRVFAMTLMDILTPQGATSTTLDGIRSSISNIENEEVRGALLTLLNNSENDLGKFRSSIETWFNDAMDRVSGWYKRQLQVITFVIALGIVLAFNVDTVVLVNAFSQDSTLRAAVVAYAEKAAANATPVAQATATETPAPANTPPAPSDATGTTAQGETPTDKDAGSVSDSLTRISTLKAELDNLQLPIGWSLPCKVVIWFSGTCENPPDPKDPRQLPHNLNEFLSKIAGLFFTALAISLGAPFWFDVLNKFLNVRATGTPPKNDSGGQADNPPPPQMIMLTAGQTGAGQTSLGGQPGGAGGTQRSRGLAKRSRGPAKRSRVPAKRSRGQRRVGVQE